MKNLTIRQDSASINDRSSFERLWMGSGEDGEEVLLNIYLENKWVSETEPYFYSLYITAFLPRADQESVLIRTSRYHSNIEYTNTYDLIDTVHRHAPWVQALTLTCLTWLRTSQPGSMFDILKEMEWPGYTLILGT